MQTQQTEVENVVTDEPEFIGTQPTPEQMRDFMRLMSRHTPGKEKKKAKIKAKNRSRAKSQKTSRRNNRK